jgi:molybdate transport system regulatory protein
MRVGRLKLKLQLTCGEGFAIGPGKADVLEAIDREGSISAAGRVLGMSYRRSWLLVDEMNRCFSGKVVETTSGGAVLSDLGRAALAAYRELEAQSVALTESVAYRRLTDLLRDEPLRAKPVP